MRIAIVNDLPLAVEAIRRVLLDSSGHSVAWIARDGAHAVEQCARDLPDLILMDLIMPVMDGVEATRKIMANTPCAILIVTASVLGNTAKVFEAMGAGALDVCQTPVLSGKHGNSTQALLYKINSISILIGPDERQIAQPGIARQVANSLPVPLVAIGASAGGPGAVAEILAALPKNFPAGIVIVQHVDAHFVDGLVEWLNTKSNLPVRVARDGDQIQPGTVLLAGGDLHLVLRDRGSFGYTGEPCGNIYRPSVNTLFESIARHWKGKAMGVLLTGMGRDGASGLLALRTAGHHTIAQDRATCAVYGMPKAAVELGSAVEVLPLPRIAQALIRFGKTTNKEKK